MSPDDNPKLQALPVPTFITLPVKRSLPSLPVNIYSDLAEHCHRVIVRANSNSTQLPPTMPSFTIILVGVAAVIAAYIYLFGIPPQLKREMEQKALQTIGENKASYMLKGITNPDRISMNCD